MKRSLLLTLCLALFACTSEPEAVRVSSVELNVNELTLTVGDSRMLEVIVLPAQAENKTVYWASSNNSVAYVEDGIVVAASPGIAQITVISDDNGKKAICKVTVVPRPVLVTGVTLTENSVRMFLGDELTLRAVVTPADASNKNLSWTSSNGQVATVVDGVVKAVGLGTAKITVETEDGGFKAECSVNVTEECQTQAKGPIVLDLGTVMATTAEFSGTLDVNMLTDYDMDDGGIGFIYAPVGEQLSMETARKVQISTVDSDNTFTKKIEGLKYDTEYQYTIFLYKNKICQYGETQKFRTADVSIEVNDVSVTLTTATFNGKINFDVSAAAIKFGIQYSTSESFSSGTTKSLEIGIDVSFSETVSGLVQGTTYYYRTYICQDNTYEYSEKNSFTTADVSVEITKMETTQTSVTVKGRINPASALDEVTVGILLNTSTTVTNSSYAKRLTLSSSDIAKDGTFSKTITGLTDRTYNYRYYVLSNDVYAYGEVKSFTIYTNLSSAATANCYIISAGGSYCFLTAKGNQPSEFLHLTKSASLLWESFGTDTAPAVGDLIKSVSYSNGYIAFQTVDTFKEGNAVIAAKDASGNILWSWHIWLTDEPQGQVYYNNAGTMMDRNLGATSATPGDVGALGLLYQWGRKDPFLGSSSISTSTLAKSTISWPSVVSSDSSTGTIAYATAHPTTFITYNSNNYDWYYTGSSSTDNTRWTESERTKSIYDPCPAGWRVPDGGGNGVWSKALGSSSSYSGTYNSTNEGMNFSGKFGSASTIWYPASGIRYDDGGLYSVGLGGYYWSASPNSYYAYFLDFYGRGGVGPSSDDSRAHGRSVRCQKE